MKYLKYIFYIVIVVIIFLIVTNSSYLKINRLDVIEKTNDTRNNVITIQGRVLVENTNAPPLGINTINIKNKWVWQDPILKIRGENRKAYIDKKGYYKIQIELGDTLQLIPSDYLYSTSQHNNIITNFKQSQTINFTLKVDSTNFKKQLLHYPESQNYIYNALYKVNPENLITVSGTIYSKNTKAPLKNIDITTLGIFNTDGTSNFNLTNESGYFSMVIPQYTRVLINPFNLSNRLDFSASKDTILNILL